MNNSIVGFTFQKLICDRFLISPSSSKAATMFETNYDASIKKDLIPIIERIFKLIGYNPIRCTTFEKYGNKDLPFNFILSNNETVSIRTNISGDKVAPREVGQAGYEKLNEYFSIIYGKEISNQDDIKHLICEHIQEVLPIFFEHLFDADYIVWIYKENERYNFELIRGNSFVDIELEKNKFSFTRDYIKWTESTTLKYEGTSIAEIQVHTNRTFKFRFIMKNVLKYIKNRVTTNETLGITAEKTICDLFDLKYPSSFISRYDPSAENEMKPIIIKAFENLPPAVQHSGSSKGDRGQQSKCSYDFILLGNKTLSLKTNTGKMVCPPEVGQPNSDTCYFYFKRFVKEDYIDRVNFKKMVYEHIDEMITIYIEHLFDSDYLLRINYKKDKYEYQIVEKYFGINIKWDKRLFSFSKTTIEEWKESTTVYYKNVSLGEFQVHNNRNCYKFRFNFDNLIYLIEREEL